MLMRPIPDIHLNNHYQTEFSSALEGLPMNIPQLIKTIDAEDNPVNFRNQLLSISQLYFDGLIKTKNGADMAKGATWAEQAQALYNLNLAGKKAIGSFYRGKGIDFDGVKEIFMPYASAIIQYGGNDSIAKHRNIFDDYNTVHAFGRNLYDECRNITGIDTIVCVAGGGFEPSYLAMDILEKEELAVMRYSSYRSMPDSNVKLPKFAPKGYINDQIKNKKVLVIEDYVVSGKSLNKVMNYISKRKSREIYCTTVIGSNFYLPCIKQEVLNGSEEVFCEKEEDIRYIILHPGRFLKKIIKFPRI